MSAEFIDTNILIYAHDRGAAIKYDRSAELLTRLFEAGDGALSIQVLSEFYAAATKKLHMEAAEAEEIIADLRSWTIHRPGHSDLLQASRLRQRFKIQWWDALIIHSATELGCSTLWTEDHNHNQRFGSVTVRNPFLLPS